MIKRRLYCSSPCEHHIPCLDGTTTKLSTNLYATKAGDFGIELSFRVGQDGNTVATHSLIFNTGKQFVSKMRL